MTKAALQRVAIEGLVRDWLASLTPEEREREGSKLVGFLAARMAFWIDRKTVATLFYELGDQVVITAAPDRDPT